MTTGTEARSAEAPAREKSGDPTYSRLAKWAAVGTAGLVLLTGCKQSRHDGAPDGNPTSTTTQDAGGGGGGGPAEYIPSGSFTDRGAVCAWIQGDSKLRLLINNVVKNVAGQEVDPKLCVSLYSEDNFGQSPAGHFMLSNNTKEFVITVNEDSDSRERVLGHKTDKDFEAVSVPGADEAYCDKETDGSLWLYQNGGNLIGVSGYELKSGKGLLDCTQANGSLMALAKYLVAKA